MENAAATSSSSSSSSGEEWISGVPDQIVGMFTVIFVLCMFACSMMVGAVMQILRRRWCVKRRGPTGYATVQVNAPVNLVEFTG